MVNAHFKCKFIPQLKGLIDVINYWNWEDKERVKRRDAGSIQTGTPFGYWVIIEAVDLGFRFGLYVWKAKT
jgi:hypothetical protein